MADTTHSGFVGPKSWVVSAVLGVGLGIGLSFIAPVASAAGVAPTIPIWLIVPFAGLLLSIALGPLLAPHFWHRRYPDVALVLGGMVSAYYLRTFSLPGASGTMSYGGTQMLHALIEFYAFIALVGGMFIVSGNVLVRIKAPASPLKNTLILAAGAVIANLVGTTGASMLLIRPFIRLNHGRIRAIHIVFFIFIVSNCGGSLTPIGDPPLYLGFLKGVPFVWTMEHLLKDWLLVNGALLAIFYFVDRRILDASETLEQPSTNFSVTELDRMPLVKVEGTTGLVCLGLMLVGVFIDPVLSRFVNLHHIPVGATFQIFVASACYFISHPRYREANRFNFEPVKEVGMLFTGIFATMVPALGYLSANGATLGINSPTHFYFATGTLSALLDNAPTYLNFLQIAMVIEGQPEFTKEAVLKFVASPRGDQLLHAISASAVFFGALTYIGNGPNFMVKAVAEGESIKMPSFFGYVGLSCMILLPILVVNWLLFVSGIMFPMK
ncbi:MAG: sodium:proton antiporter [Planctomycetes bacterium]|nr:sodium:proton antiporter [Planctomycetota bacterium]